ncbi:Hypothetical predicted protein [Marmota monax]|uniref:Uncharacterized protein n=1 Tax=Marmota monax TaxID=9995 RepID=A0A5E4BUF0_MARMO|nr:Hypothetical predicted protein [Marmota monax]
MSQDGHVLPKAEYQGAAETPPIPQPLSQPWVLIMSPVTQHRGHASGSLLGAGLPSQESRVVHRTVCKGPRLCVARYSGHQFIKVLTRSLGIISVIFQVLKVGIGWFFIFL